MPIDALDGQEDERYSVACASSRELARLSPADVTPTMQREAAAAMDAVLVR
jgi:hypothetical protein